MYAFESDDDDNSGDGTDDSSSDGSDNLLEGFLENVMNEPSPNKANGE